MSSPSEHEPEKLSPNEPSYYAPRWLRQRSEPAAAPLDTRLEKAASNALWRPLDPEVIREPRGLAEELDRGAALITVAGRFAAAVGVSAIVALFFVIMVPASRLPDGGGLTSSGLIKSIKAALLQPGQRDERPAIAEFQPVLASAQGGQPAAREESGQLLQQFLQWRQKPSPTETTQ